MRHSRAKKPGKKETANVLFPIATLFQTTDHSAQHVSYGSTRHVHTEYIMYDLNLVTSE